MEGRIMTRKPKMMQFLRKLQEIQQKYIDTVALEVRVRKYNDDGCMSITGCFLSDVRKVKKEDGEDDTYIANLSLYTFYDVKENKAALDAFIKDVKRENQLILAKSFKSCKN